jgi:translation elongation factor EF-G
MRIELDLVKTRELNDIYHSIEEKGRKELHLTDGLYCPLKAFCRIKGLTAVWTRKTQARFNIGNDLHGEFELPFEHHEVEVRFGPSTGHPDVVIKQVPNTESGTDSLWDGPLEFKHTTLVIPSIGDIPLTWIEQVKLECVYTKTLHGWLAILELISGCGKVWKISFTTEDIEDAGDYHLACIDMINAAVNQNTPEILEPVRRECSSCQYNHERGCPKRPGIGKTIFGCPVKVIG